MEKKLACWEATWQPLDGHWLPLSECSNHNPKKKSLSQEMHLQISHAGCQLKLSNFKCGCKVAALYSLLNWRPPIAFWRSVDEWMCVVRFLNATLCLTAGKRVANWNCHAAGGQQKPMLCTFKVHAKYTPAILPWKKKKKKENRDSVKLGF